MRQALAAYAGQIKQATATDQYIQNMINQQKSAPTAQGEQNINAMLERAAGFYNELELRLEQIHGSLHEGHGHTGNSSGEEGLGQRQNLSVANSLLHLSIHDELHSVEQHVT